MKFEIKDLTVEERWVALSWLLIHKGIITQDELIDALQDNVDMQNEELAKRLKDDPEFIFKVMQYKNER